MIPMKKCFSDSLIQLAIVLSLLRTDLNNLLNSGISTYPEVQEIMLGQTYAYTLTNFHSQNVYNSFDGIGHIHPKSVDSYWLDVFQDIQQLGPDHVHSWHTNENVISAWLVDGQSYELPAVAEAVAPVSTEVNNNNNNSSSQSSGLVTQENVESTVHNESETTQIVGGVVESSDGQAGSELTKEDMDLIEILWHQDIDLGIGRDGFDANLRQELEKERELEQQKQTETPSQSSDQEEEIDWDNFMVDNETGEVIPAHPTLGGSITSEYDVHLGNDTEQAISQMDVLGDEQQMTPVQADTNISTLLQTPDDQLDREISELIHQVQQNDSQFGRQNSLEQRWNDISSLLNLTVTNSTVISSEGTPPSVVDMAVTSAPLQTDMYSPASTETMTGIQDTSLALIQNTSFAPVTSPADCPFEHYFNSVSPQPSLAPTINSTSPSELYNAADEGMLFPDVANMINESASYYDQSFFLPDVMEDDLTLDHEIAQFNLDSGVQQLHLQEISDDSAVSSMGSLSPQDWNDTLSTNGSSGMTSPFDGLEGATGGGYESSSQGGSSQKTNGFSDSMGGFYLDSSDMEINETTNQSASFTPAQIRHVTHNHSYPLQPGQQPRERKSDKKPEPDKQSTSRDEKRLKTMKVPLTMDEIVHSSVDAFNEMLQKHRFSDEQVSLMRDIRRRGKNKVAAQNCRKRKMTVVSSLEDELDELKSERSKEMKAREAMKKELKNLRDKYDQLYQEMFRSLRDANGAPYRPGEYSLQQSSDGSLLLVPANSTREEQGRQRSVKKRKNPKKN